MAKNIFDCFNSFVHMCVYINICECTCLFLVDSYICMLLVKARGQLCVSLTRNHPDYFWDRIPHWDQRFINSARLSDQQTLRGLLVPACHQAMLFILVLEIKLKSSGWRTSPLQNKLPLQPSFGFLLIDEHI